MRRLPFAPALLLLALCIGCAARPQALSDPWARRNGGIICPEDLRQRRSDEALARLKRLLPTPLTVQVLDNDTPTAYAFRAGRLYVTRALVDLTTPDELAAALAHELGHLADPRKLAAPRALSGGLPPADAESRADAAALTFLRTAGVPPLALATLLEKVQTHPATPTDLRASLAARIFLLTSAH